MLMSKKDKRKPQGMAFSKSGQSPFREIQPLPVMMQIDPSLVANCLGLFQGGCHDD